MKWILFVFISGTILCLAGLYSVGPTVIETAPTSDKSLSLPEENQQIKIILTGDIMLDRGVEYMIEKYGNGDFRFPFLKIADYLKNSDIVFSNLEGPISDKGEKVGSIYSFRAKPEAIEGLSFAGFNVISLANNHAFDYDGEALEDCFAKLNNESIGYVGAGFSESEAYSPFIKELNDSTSSPLRIGFLSYTNLGPETWRATGSNSGIAWISENDFERIKEGIKSAEGKSDILIVSLHAGEEYQKTPTPSQVEFFKMAIDAGADIVVGHHSHTVQSNEKYEQGYIFYSLGNFIFDQSFSEETMTGQVVEVLIENKKIKEVIPKNIRINNYFQPEIIL